MGNPGDSQELQFVDLPCNNIQKYMCIYIYMYM